MGHEYLTAEESAQIKKSVNTALKGIFKKHENRDRSSIADVENPLRQTRRGDAERAIAKMHSTADSRREIRKAAPGRTDAANAIAAMHSSRDLAGRTISGNRRLVEKLTVALGRAVLKEYGSVREAKAEIRKLMSDNDERAFAVLATAAFGASDLS
jgi:hypothetical protein